MLQIVRKVGSEPFKFARNPLGPTFGECGRLHAGVGTCSPTDRRRRTGCGRSTSALVEFEAGCDKIDIVGGPGRYRGYGAVTTWLSELGRSRKRFRRTLRSRFVPRPVRHTCWSASIGCLGYGGVRIAMVAEIAVGDRVLVRPYPGQPGASFFRASASLLPAAVAINRKAIPRIARSIDAVQRRRRSERGVEDLGSECHARVCQFSWSAFSR